MPRYLSTLGFVYSSGLPLLVTGRNKFLQAEVIFFPRGDTTCIFEEYYNRVYLVVLIGLNNNSTHYETEINEIIMSSMFYKWYSEGSHLPCTYLYPSSFRSKVVCFER